MLIECVLQRPEPIEVPIGNEKYRFEEDSRGRKVCEVWIEDHIDCFLAVPHLYRQAREDGPVNGAFKPARRAAEVRPGVDDMKRPAIMAELKERGVSFDIRAKNDELRDILSAARCR